MRKQVQTTLTTLDDYSDPGGKRDHLVGDFSWVTPQTPLSSVDMNWREKGLPEKLRTKHVHRLHPYLGKFIPQIVEIFLRKFEPRTVCDPFSGSGTTLVEANALGIASMGCDISSFNCLLSEVKTKQYDTRKLEREIKTILSRTVTSAHDQHKSQRLLEEEQSSYLRKWFASKALKQLLLYRCMIDGFEYSDVLKIILSRSARSARLTTHFDLDFPKRPQTEPYHCYKHGRTCKPTDDALTFLSRYSIDTIERIKEFSRIRTDAPATILCEDSRTVKFPQFDTIITSPPYVGLIDYHEQHRYAYELLHLPDKREREIGAAANGSSKRAKEDYVKGITEVFTNARKAISDTGAAVVIVHDKNSFYQDIATKSGFEAQETVTRNVNRRTGRRGEEFFEQILIWRAT